MTDTHQLPDHVEASFVLTIDELDQYAHPIEALLTQLTAVENRVRGIVADRAGFEPLGTAVIRVQYVQAVRKVADRE